MLLAVEGGGFFSSSASGYSKGLTLLLLGQKNEEKPMRVAPWTQYQLVDQETDPVLQLASDKNHLVRGCASFVCFGCAAAGPEGPSPPKVGPTQNQEVLPGPLEFDEIKDQVQWVNPVVDDDDCNRKIDNSLKSSLKKSVDIAPGNSNKHGSSCKKGDDVACQMERRRVQWTDAIGGELFEIREFEMGEDGSDDEFDHANRKTCACRIM